MATTQLSNIINPEVMADMISAKLPKALKAKGFMKVDTTLTGKAGNTITVPQYAYIGEAADLAEGAAGTVTQLTATEKEYVVKKAVKNVELTDEAVLSGYGDPVGEVTRQLTMAIEDKIDSDGIAVLEAITSSTPAGANYVTSTETTYNYNMVCDGLDALPNSEDEGEELYLLIPKAGIKALRRDERFIDKNNGEILGTGVVGSVAGCKVVVSAKLSDTSKAAYIMRPDALTAFIKRDVSLETDRNVLNKKTLFSADEHFVVAIEDLNKIVKVVHSGT